MVECYICKKYIKPDEAVTAIAQGDDTFIIHSGCDRRDEKEERKPRETPNPIKPT